MPELMSLYCRIDAKQMTEDLMNGKVTRVTRVKCADGRAMFLKCIASLLKASNGWLETRNWFMQWFLWVRWLMACCHFPTLDHRCTWVIFIWI